MGYSLGVRTRSPKLAQKMLAFMGEHYRSWSEVIGSKTRSISTRPLSDDISYGQKKGIIGFDYASHCFGWERIYVFCLMRWIALRVGVRRSKFRLEERTIALSAPVPFISYDGNEDWPILVVGSIAEAMKVPKERRWCCTDTNGVYLNAQVNQILAIECEDIWTDEAMTKAFAEEMFNISKEDPDRREKLQAVRAKYAQPEIDRMLPKVQAELERLNKLWEA